MVWRMLTPNAQIHWGLSGKDGNLDCSSGCQTGLAETHRLFHHGAHSCYQHSMAFRNRKSVNGIGLFPHREMPRNQ